MQAVPKAKRCNKLPDLYFRASILTPYTPHIFAAAYWSNFFLRIFHLFLGGLS